MTMMVFRASVVFAFVAPLSATCSFTVVPPVVVVERAAIRTRLHAAAGSNFFTDLLGATKSGKTNVIAGSTGYIGRNTVRESVRRGYNTIALVRDIRRVDDAAYGKFFEGATLVECDVCDAAAVTQTIANIAEENNGIEAMISCLASRSGTKKDAYAIDYQATLNCLNAARSSGGAGVGHFVLLSAFCVKNPWLQFQKAKLEFEAALQAQSDISYTIIRPTAFFKSVSGQLELVQSGAPFVMFGDGKATRCNPISEADLATYIIDSIDDNTRKNKIINLGGPDEPLTMLRQGEMLFEAVGKKQKFIFAPLWIFDVIIDTLQWFADAFRNERLEDAAELSRIGKYYAVEDMLTENSEEKFGTMTLMDYYRKIAVEGQEYDPYTTMFAKNAPKEKIPA